MAEGKGAVKTAITNVDTAGGLFNIANPEGEDLLITKVVVNLTTKSTAACTADIGVEATLTLDDTLLDGIDLNAAADVFDNIDDQGTNGKATQLWPSDEYLTGSVASGASAGAVGYVYVQYIRV